jgi:NAD(P)-dependent dehydrogenase (short-subunit alcohol dehydrogenase family)
MRSDTRKRLWWLGAGLGAVAAGCAALRASRKIRLQGKVVLVTGASRGLGLVIARQLAAHGARLAICARDEEELERARTDLVRRGADVLAVPCDITDQEQVQDLVRTVLGRFGAIDVLINNAGVIEVGPVEVMTLTDYEEAMRTHYWGPLFNILEVLPHMKRRGSGRIVNITSIGGKIAFPHLVPYDASKFALVGLSEGLRAELLKDNIYVTTVVPGLMRTGSPRNATFKGQHRAEYVWFSISDSLPVASIGAERAARQIVSALRHGDAEVILSLPAQLAVRLHGLMPGLTAEALALVNRMLPGPGGIGTGRALGKESTSAWSPSPLTALTEAAARRNNEYAANENHTTPRDSP